ncbi:hypothetical protein VNO77_41769 [Canavalia gladiata]|uniref:Uncharacterized protein n=1 Tax=Canavalia gladiata TaxID=3824 RepID=A0AAN9JZU8_CANGL
MEILSQSLPSSDSRRRHLVDHGILGSRQLPCVVELGSAFALIEESSQQPTWRCLGILLAWPTFFPWSSWSHSASPDSFTSQRETLHRRVDSV